MPRVLIELNCPNFFDLHITSHAHGWRNLAPFSWDEESESLRFAAWANSQPVDFILQQNGESLEASLVSHEELNSESVESAKKIVNRVVGIDIDTSDLLKTAERVGVEYAALVKRGAGRILRSPTLWEDAAKTLFTTNCSWALTTKMCASVCSEHFSDAAPSGKFPFPHPEVICEFPEDKLRTLMPIGYRAGYLLKLGEHFTGDIGIESIVNGGYSYRKVQSMIRELKGFGIYATTHLLVLLGYYRKVPIDTVAVSYLKKHHRFRSADAFVERHYQKWGPYRWWGFKLEKMLNNQNWLGD